MLPTLSLRLSAGLTGPGLCNDEIIPNPHENPAQGSRPPEGRR